MGTSPAFLATMANRHMKHLSRTVLAAFRTVGQVKLRSRRTGGTGNVPEESGAFVAHKGATAIEDHQQGGMEEQIEESPPPGGPGGRFLESKWFPWASWGLSAVALG